MNFDTTSVYVKSGIQVEEAEHKGLNAHINVSFMVRLFNVCRSIWRLTMLPCRVYLYTLYILCIELLSSIPLRSHCVLSVETLIAVYIVYFRYVACV